MKKATTLLAAGIILAGLTACGENESASSSEGDVNNENNVEEVNNEPEEENENNEVNEANDINEENEENETNEVNEANDVNEEEAVDEIAEDEETAQIGETIENEAGEFVLKGQNMEGRVIETGPIVLTIEKINTISGTVSPAYQDLIGADELEYVQVDIHVENTSDEDVNFFSSQGTMSTSTGEQLETDMFLSGHIPGELMAGTQASDTFFYILENSNAEDVESVRIKWSSPNDIESWDNIGDEVDESFDIEQ